MRDFRNRLQINNEQKKEVERYLGNFTVMTEYGFLQMVRKIKKLEEKIGDKKYEI